MRRVNKAPVFGIAPRNAEQTFALSVLCDPEIPLVSLSGTAGTGKTLLALAAALEQRRNYRQIFLARPIVPLSNKDIGYLPGEIKAQARSLHAADLRQPRRHHEPRRATATATSAGDQQIQQMLDDGEAHGLRACRTSAAAA